MVKSKKNKLLENKLSRFWKKLGSRILFMLDLEHDKVFVVTSHFPHLVAYNLIKTAHSKGLKVHVWTINSQDTMESLINMNVDGIMTDDAVLLKNVCSKANLF